MTARLWRALLITGALLAASPTQAQITVLDQAQDALPITESEEEAAPPPPCGTQPITIARMSWPSAELLAEIHMRILERSYGCDARLTPGDLGTTASSMGSTGQPGVAPEMWATRIADVWNAGIDAQMLRPAAPSYVETQFEGWFIPRYLAMAFPDLVAAADLPATLPVMNDGAPVRFISCPPDWACALINRNLIKALGLEDMVEVVEPATRFEMDTLIAEAVSRDEAIVFYYWQPNAVLAQFDFAALDMGAFDPEAAKCLAQVTCPAPTPSAFPAETVVIALAEWVFTDIPAISAYFQRSSLPLAEMNELLAQMNEAGATAAGVAERFVAESEDVWGRWVDATP